MRLKMANPIHQAYSKCATHAIVLANNKIDETNLDETTFIVVAQQERNYQKKLENNGSK